MHLSAYKRQNRSAPPQEIPLVMSSDERDFEADETDYLLQSPNNSHRMNGNRPRRARNLKNLFFTLTCGAKRDRSVSPKRLGTIHGCAQDLSVPLAIVVLLSALFRQHCKEALSDSVSVLGRFRSLFWCA
ncbi:hypothetical protein J6590_014239 [Homalodisca vitripennis]|nr:hypothetical protein J6590_014239 [Homalodisca vitripennis]